MLYPLSYEGEGMQDTRAPDVGIEWHAPRIARLHLGDDAPSAPHTRLQDAMGG